MPQELLEVLIKMCLLKAIQFSILPPLVSPPFSEQIRHPCSSTAGVAKKAGAWEVLYADCWVRRPSFEIPKRPLVFSTVLMYPVQDRGDVRPQNIKFRKLHHMWYWKICCLWELPVVSLIYRRTRVLTGCFGGLPPFFGRKFHWKLQATRTHLGSQQLHCLPGPSGATRTRLGESDCDIWRFV